MTWSHLETSINFTISAIYDNWHGAKVDPKIPNVSMKRKIKFLRDWFNQSPNIMSQNTWIPIALEYLTTLSKIRNAIAHGIMEYDLNLEWSKIEEASFTINGPDKNKHGLVLKKINIQQLDSVSRLFIAMTDLWHQFRAFLEGRTGLNDHYRHMTEKLSLVTTLLDDVADIFEQARVDS